MSIENCTCDLTTACGEYDEAGCPACRDSDVYLPCPVFGFMCWPPLGPGDVCDCCTPEQQAMTRRYFANSSASVPTPEVGAASPVAPHGDAAATGGASNVP